ncbi:hypothetical protein PIB30_030551 [Stylosanthes scabra]|uniref:Uncharacterized protein n=1 Tax=Stylosanthes scabra TaxID=79078 RepID=A0ABU6RBT9_9FABA|nr:hypothetical protein [Stylosanthes scabra]
MAASSSSSSSAHIIIVHIFLLCIPSFSLSLVHAITTSNKLNQPASVVALPPDAAQIKCGSCPCGDTCDQQLSPPPPPPPPLPQPCPPPPPPPSPPLPPPPPPKSPSCPQNCNPLSPPPPRFIYVPVPGQVNQPKPTTWIYYYSAAENRGVGWLVLVGLGALSLTTVFG